MRDDRLAKRMFLGGCFGLPLLWFFNVLYFRKEVYGPNRFLDSPNEDENEGGEAQTTGISTDGIPNFGSLGINSTESDSDDENSDEESDEDSIPSHIMKLEVSKWVKWSSIGSLIWFMILVSWNIIFQIKSASFGPNWFVMSEDLGELTGW